MKKNRCGGQKKKKRKERERREKEDEDRDASVSTTSQVPPPSLLPAPLLPPTTPVGLLPTRRPPVTVMTVNTDDSDDDYEPYATFPPPAQWPAHIRDFVYGPRSPVEMLADTVPPTRTDIVPIAAVVNTPAAPRLVPVPAKAAATTARDWSVLQVGCTNPWRTIRRRKHRLRTCCWDAPYIPVTVSAVLRPVSLPEPAPILNLHEHQSQDVPLHPNDTPAHTVPLPIACPCPEDHIPGPRLHSADTPFGLVHSSLAMVCAGELPEPQKIVDALALLAWGTAEDLRRDLLLDLPPDSLVFLGVLSMVGIMESDFRPFLLPAMLGFIKHWVGD
ncbi:hypothetical protein R3P38DRAFT_2910422 [Favolaschia claudopus]|uniref:Uncharacterized protein n=1 Tax=Favolaschia claudopus TaxID=2862362 RepID=A0AAW0CAP7_9AGAR